MAQPPTKRHGEAPPGSLAALGEEAESRLDDARNQKRKIQTYIEECNYFAAPRRVRSISTKNKAPNPTQPTDADELQTSIGIEVAEDFMTMLIDSFMPQHGRWAERLADPFTPEAKRRRIEQDARKEDEGIFKTIRASNFHAALAQQGVPDAAIGVIAMQIDDVGAHRPVRCIGVAIGELEMNLGPDGRIDDRFVVRKKKYRHLRALLRGINLTEEIERKIKEEPEESVDVVWGYWRLWDRDDDEHWQHVVLVEKEPVHRAQIKGEGCCPLVIGRIGSLPDFVWPEGPMIRALPDLRQIDETQAAFIENIDFTLRPPMACTDPDANLEGGIEPGWVIPVRQQGPGDVFQKIYEPNPLDAAIFMNEETKRRVRRLHYVDFPEQKGKTPPTLGQWLDEMVEAQKKIGTPGYAFWREFPYEAFSRFKYIGEVRGNVRPVMADLGNGRQAQASLHAYNPAQRAQENQEVLVASRLLQIAMATFPQVAQAVIDPIATNQAIQEKLGDQLVKIRTQEDFTEAVGMVSQLVSGGGASLPGGISGPPSGQ
jgi:hypothetical protein